MRFRRLWQFITSGVARSALRSVKGSLTSRLWIITNTSRFFVQLLLSKLSGDELFELFGCLAIPDIGFGRNAFSGCSRMFRLAVPACCFSAQWACRDRDGGHLAPWPEGVIGGFSYSQSAPIHSEYTKPQFSCVRIRLGEFRNCTNEVCSS